MNNKVSLYDIRSICEEFNVEFKISCNNEDKTLKYHFGDKVSWVVAFGEDFHFYHLIEVIKRLSATYPEKVLQ